MSRDLIYSLEYEGVEEEEEDGIKHYKWNREI